MSGVISLYAPSGRARLPFCLPWFSAISNNSTVDPHSLIIRGMRTEPLTGTVIGPMVLPYPKTEYVSITLYLQPLPYTDRWSKSRSEYGVCLCLFLFPLSSIDSWANPKLKDPCQLSLGSKIWPVKSEQKEVSGRKQKKSEEGKENVLIISKPTNFHNQALKLSHEPDWLLDRWLGLNSLSVKVISVLHPSGTHPTA
jgi:hypothetical protein